MNLCDSEMDVYIFLAYQLAGSNILTVVNREISFDNNNDNHSQLYYSSSSFVIKENKMQCSSKEKAPIRVIQVKISKAEKLSNKGCSGDCANCSRSKKP